MLLNRRPPGMAWLGVRLVADLEHCADGAGCARVAAGSRSRERSSGRRFLDVYGARARIAGRSGWQWAHTDGSYAAASDPRLLFPLTAGPAPATVEVVWPDGALEEFVRLTPNRYHVLRRGAGTAVETR